MQIIHKLFVPIAHPCIKWGNISVGLKTAKTEANLDFFSGRRKVVLQTRIFFLVGDPEKKNLSLQNHFFATLKITFNGAD